MNPQEILPEPERAAVRAPQYESFDDTGSERASTLQREHKQTYGAGGTALSGVSVTNAQGQVASTLDPGMVGSVATTLLTDVQNPSTAEDLDLIEKEWVLKAKAIVAATLGDPYSQSQQINRIKADYIKKRYNRDVKVRDK
jgi:hypothetical protein